MRVGCSRYTVGRDAGARGFGDASRGNTLCLTIVFGRFAPTFRGSRASNTRGWRTRGWRTCGWRMNGEPESNLVARCRAGDQAAFRELLELFHQRIFAVAYAFVHDPDEAAEVEQETFVKAWRGLPSFRGDAALGTWLSRLAVNTARDHLRRRQARALLSGLLSWRASTGQDALDRVVERDELDHALSRVPATIRQTLALRYGAGLSVREVAEALGCAEGTVKWRLSTGVAQLRELLVADRLPDFSRVARGRQ
jgi:RNA polymerase sigma-70 factor, ECF subfamily